MTIFLGFLVANPDDLFSVQSIISVLGAYFIGKDLWDDIENGLVALSGDRRLRYQKSYYLYRLEQNTTLTAYSALARERRHGSASLLPDEVDFIQLSNSQTVRLLFRRRRLCAFPKATAHLMSIHLREDLREPFERDGFMFGVKFAFNRRVGPVTVSLEAFQSLDNGARGSLHADDWQPDAVAWRRVLIIRNLRWYSSRGVLQGSAVVQATERTSSGT